HSAVRGENARLGDREVVVQRLMHDPANNVPEDDGGGIEQGQPAAIRGKDEFRAPQRNFFDEASGRYFPELQGGEVAGGRQEAAVWRDRQRVGLPAGVQIEETVTGACIDQLERLALFF